MGIVAQPLLVLVTAERKSESVETTEAALHNEKNPSAWNTFLFKERFMFLEVDPAQLSNIQRHGANDASCWWGMSDLHCNVSQYCS